MKTANFNKLYKKEDQHPASTIRLNADLERPLTEIIKPLEILIVVFNQEFLCKRIIANIESYINNNIGVLIQDDCSTDRTFEVLSTHFQNHPDVKILKTVRNLGPIGNFASLSAQATSEYVICLGGDDFVNQGELQQILKLLASDPFDIGVFNCAHAELEIIDQLILGAARTSNKYNIIINNKHFTDAVNLSEIDFFHRIATMPGALWLQGVILRTSLLKQIPKMESRNVDDWGILHNLAVHGLKQPLRIKFFKKIITLLTIVKNSRGSQVDEQLTRQLTAVVNDWHPSFRKDAFFNVIEKKLKQFKNTNSEIEKIISIFKNSFSKI
jgi:glycosyltransferase involved in cell wall biosynthesis